MTKLEQRLFFMDLVRSSSDGCTFFPDLPANKQPCVIHDTLYRTPSELTHFTRQEADKLLRRQVSDNGRPVLALIMYIGVRLFGGGPWKREQKRGRELLKIIRRLA